MRSKPVASDHVLPPTSWISVSEKLHYATKETPASDRYQKWMSENSHLHAYSEVQVCLSGRHSYGLNGRAIALEPGSALLIPSQIPHDSRYSTHHQKCTDLWLHLLPNGFVAMKVVCHDPEQRTTMHPLLCSEPGLSRDLKRASVLISQTKPGELAGAKKSGAFLLYTLHALFEFLSQDFIRPVAVSYTPVIESIKEYATKHLTDRLDLDELARIAGFSPFHFHRMFSQSEGITPRHFIETKRIEHACHLIRNGHSMTSAAFDSGFASSSQFARVFKKHHQVSPKDWLKQLAAA